MTNETLDQSLDLIAESLMPMAVVTDRRKRRVLFYGLGMFFCLGMLVGGFMGSRTLNPSALQQQVKQLEQTQGMKRAVEGYELGREGGTKKEYQELML